jgi:protoporphyrinogen oxidase
LVTIKNLILGGGLSGLSVSFHLGHSDCLILEEAPRLFGLLATRRKNGFTWDNGPHVSFTKNEFVQKLFAESAQGDFHDIPVNVGNFFSGHWIPHPAQVNLAQVPEPLRSACVADLKQLSDSTPTPANYQEWLEASLGKTFADNFSAAYTRKYWTVPPVEMSCDWVGGRVHRPRLEDVLAGAEKTHSQNFHYINRIRYPKHGGYQSFAASLALGANVQLNSRVVSVDLKKKQVRIESGDFFSYERLISTIPLPVFVSVCEQSTPEMRTAASALLCTSVFLVEVELPYSVEQRPEHWFYIYDEDMLSTRIHFTEKLSPENVPSGKSGVQVEVYFSDKKPLPVSEDELIPRVLSELVEMGILKNPDDPRVQAHSTKIPFANVAFLTDTARNLEVLWSAFAEHGLQREPADTAPMTNWAQPTSSHFESSPLWMAGRFAQWKYFWTDDCILRGKQLADSRIFERGI